MSARNDPRRRAPESYPWHLELQLRFGDCDMQGHLNNVAVARLYEETRVRFITQLRNAVFADGGHAPVVAHLAIDYLGEGRYPGEVSAGACILATGRTSFRVGAALFQNGSCIGLNETVLANMGAGGPVPLTDAWRAGLESWRIKG